MSAEIGTVTHSLHDRLDSYVALLASANAEYSRLVLSKRRSGNATDCLSPREIRKPKTPVKRLRVVCAQTLVDRTLLIIYTTCVTSHPSTL